MRGYFITLEGGEGCGKTTQIKLLAKKLKNCIVTHEPWKYRSLILKEKIHPITELLLFLADRSEHVKFIKQQLAKGKIVLSDRFSGSTLAYQIGGRKLNEKLVREMDALARQGLKPDLVVFLDLDPRIGLKRKKGLALTRIDKEKMKFHQAVQQEFRQIAKKEKWIILNGEESIQTNAQKIFKIVKQKNRQLH